MIRAKTKPCACFMWYSIPRYHSEHQAQWVFQSSILCCYWTFNSIMYTNLIYRSTLFRESMSFGGFVTRLVASTNSPHTCQHRWSLNTYIVNLSSNAVFHSLSTGVCFNLHPLATYLPYPLHFLHSIRLNHKDKIVPMFCTLKVSGRFYTH